MTTNNHESEPTPRTDAIVRNHCEDGPFVSDHYIALSHFARTLELELNEAKKELERITTSLIDISCKGQPSKQFLSVPELRMADLFNDKKELQSQLLTAQEGAKQIELRANEEARDLSAQIVTAQKTIGEMREALEKAKIKHTFKL